MAAVPLPLAWEHPNRSRLSDKGDCHFDTIPGTLKFVRPISFLLQ